MFRRLAIFLAKKYNIQEKHIHINSEDGVYAFNLGSISMLHQILKITEDENMDIYKIKKILIKTIERCEKDGQPTKH